MQGILLLHSGIATGAENILIPERKTDVEELVNSLLEKESRKKLVNLVVVAEGDEFGGANEVHKIYQRAFAQCRYPCMHSWSYSAWRFSILSRQVNCQPDGLFMR